MAARADYECKIGTPGKLGFKLVTVKEKGSIIITYHRIMEKREPSVDKNGQKIISRVLRPDNKTYPAIRENPKEETFRITGRAPQNELIKWELRIFKADGKISARLQLGSSIQKFARCQINNS